MPLYTVAGLTGADLDLFTRLSENQLKHYYEPHGGLFLAESLKTVERALASGCEPAAMLIEDKYRTHPLVVRYLEKIPVYEAPFPVLKQLVGYSMTGGMVCAMRRPLLPDAEEILRGRRRIAVLDHVTNQTNVGAIFRSAAALGIEGVLVTKSSCDPLYRRSVRVSMGTVFRIPWTIVGDAGYLPLLKKNGFLTGAMALREASVPADSPVLREAPRLALILGNEGYGLPDEVIEACDRTVMIPMAEGVDSLNVAAAAAVAFWSAVPRDPHNSQSDL